MNLRPDDVPGTLDYAYETFDWDAWIDGYEAAADDTDVARATRVGLAWRAAVVDDFVGQITGRGR